ncbi:MAG: DNA polymerase I [Mollicutes bacterium]|nr:DNA polymerase I [Mollicutes bacterium]
MKKIIMVDGNNLLFRSYYATAYSGNFMRNSKGFPTNAIYGFIGMINNIVEEEKPEYMIVAFDKGETFRHKEFKEYKANRIAMPDELKMQFPIAKEILTHMGIKYYEIDNYEADDIIGAFAKYCENNNEFTGIIISSDKDLLQLLSENVEIKLLKQKDYIRYNLDNFEKEFGIAPINIIDLKALQGDPSDNIPGVKGIGEKTALKLLREYGSLDNIYKNIDKIKGKVKEKLINEKDNAYLSYHLATIQCDIPMDINIDDIKYTKGNEKELRKIYEELEFYSFLKDKEVKKNDQIEINIIKDVNDIKVDGPCAVYLEILGTNYHKGEILGMGVYNDNCSFYIPREILLEKPSFLKENIKYTYDLKKMVVALKWQNVEIENVVHDAMIAGYLLDYNVKDDIAYMANQMGYNISFYEKIYGKSKLVKPSEEEIAYNTVMRAKFIYETYENLKEQLTKEKTLNLYEKIDFPLARVLANMEFSGINVNRKTLMEMGEELKIKIELLSNDIYNDAGVVFNISSPSQLGEVLFERLGLKHGKKGKTGYSTAIDVLNKIRDSHPIVDKVIEYRTLTKLYTTYIEGLLSAIMNDNKIHTIFNQTLTRTGRLSSEDPNLQNIPIRYEYGRLIRKAFVPSKDSVILSCDYSQIELRILAHVSKVDALIEAFKNDMDIHKKTAMDIFKVEEYAVTPNMRRIAKAVNFGILYGMSSFGLSENLDIQVKEAQKFIDEYLETYPGIKEYMDKTIKDAYEKGYVKTLFNRKRKIGELFNKNYMIRQQGERMALNTPIQGTSADIIKKAMIEIDHIFKEKGLKSKMILQVHDELVFDVLKEELEEVKKIVKTTMEKVCELEVPLKVDMNIGESWYHAK